MDFPAVIAHRLTIWPRVLERFDASGSSASRDRFERFCNAHASWLDDFALFMAVKEAHGHAPWTMWAPDIAHHTPSAVADWTARCAREVRLHKLTQFLFFEQWHRVREACHARSIEIMGDLPIFVAHDSADVWAHRELFRLDEDGQPTVLTGVPPDYFSATGQLWGNPHYRWDALARLDTSGGSIAFVRCSRSSIVCVSIISGDSTRRGKCRRAHHRDRRGVGRRARIGALR